jgi:hypothetical protein
VQEELDGSTKGMIRCCHAPRSTAWSMRRADKIADASIVRQIRGW